MKCFGSKICRTNFLWLLSSKLVVAGMATIAIYSSDVNAQSSAVPSPAWRLPQTGNPWTDCLNDARTFFVNCIQDTGDYLTCNAEYQADIAYCNAHAPHDEPIDISHHSENRDLYTLDKK